MTPAIRQYTTLTVPNRIFFVNYTIWNSKFGAKTINNRKLTGNATWQEETQISRKTQTTRTERWQIWKKTNSDKVSSSKLEIVHFNEKSRKNVRKWSKLRRNLSTNRRKIQDEKNARHDGASNFPRIFLFFPFSATQTRLRFEKYLFCDFLLKPINLRKNISPSMRKTIKIFSSTTRKAKILAKNILTKRYRFGANLCVSSEFLPPKLRKQKIRARDFFPYLVRFLSNLLNYGTIDNYSTHFWSYSVRFILSQKFFLSF